MRVRLIALMAALFWPALSAAQECVVTTGKTVQNPTTIRMLAPFHMTLLPGSTTNWETTEYEVGIFADGVSPNVGIPRVTFFVPRAQWSPVPNIANCYEARPPDLLTIPVAETLRSALKPRRSVPDQSEGDWSPLSPDPFVRVAPRPRAVTAVGVSRD